MMKGMINNKGSITVEMLVIMIPFMLAFFTVINFARFIQAEMIIHHAITQTAKEISAYGFILTKTNIASRMQATHGKSAEFTNTVNETVDSLSDFASAFDSGDISGAIESGTTVFTNVSDFASDPGSVVSGIISCIKSGIEDSLTTTVAGGIARGSIKKQLSLMNKDPDEYLKNLGVVGGMGGLDFSKTHWISNGPGGKANVEIVVTFTMKNNLFPMFDFGEHNYILSASTLSW